VSELDRVIHEPARLQIVALLAGAKEVDFLFLLRETPLTKGNLSSHLAGLRPEGKAAFQGYRKSMNGLLK
jgi:DNA-binding transcriptional ArsR family regulator